MTAAVTDSIQVKHGVAHIALPVPMRQQFDYIIPESMRGHCAMGARVRVPFGRRHMVGVVMATGSESDLPSGQLKTIQEVVDDEPLLPETLLNLCLWASQYYHHPIGEVLWAAIAPDLRTGKPASIVCHKRYVLTEKARAKTASDFARASKQLAIWECLMVTPSMQDTLFHAQGFAPSAVRAMLERGDLRCETLAPTRMQAVLAPAPYALSEAQQDAIRAMDQAEGFAPFVLQGVTGSGKTEVYFQVIAHAIKSNQCALVIVPEIALTPQMISRFQARFGAGIALYHSGLTAHERTQVWLRAAKGLVSIVIGTRSAVWLPMPDLGMIVIDESHDMSYKQQTGFRYSARDVAMIRAKQSACRIVLGTATPSLESLYQVDQQQYRLLTLPERPTPYACPPIQCVDARQQRTEAALVPQVIERMQRVLDAGQQVLVFLNRRGYATALRCNACAWVGMCSHCDMPWVLHQGPGKLWCHHCGRQQAVPKQCPDCGFDELSALGMGTERLESQLQSVFPHVPVTRFDRDSTRLKGSMDELLSTIHGGGARIIVGTQMLAKGHHFSHVTLVVICQVDSALFSVDFRALERFGQLLVQVAGRSGREQAGQVLCQTHYPDHPMLQLLLQSGYMPFARDLLQQRQRAHLPPWARLALVHARSKSPLHGRSFLQRLMAIVKQHAGVTVSGPVPSPIHKRDQYYRWQIMLVTDSHRAMHACLHQVQHALSQMTVRDVRWAIDMDPQDMA